MTNVVSSPMATGRSCVVVGSGPNGLAAAITLAQAGRHVTVLEAEATIGGGTRSAALTLPGFVHDVCSAIHPMGIASPFFQSLPLEDFGLEWIHPHAPLAHPLDDGTAVLLCRSIDDTAASTRRRRRGISQVVRTAGRRLRHAARRHSAATPAAAPSIRAGPLWHARHALGARPRRPRYFRGERARALFAGIARALHASTRSAVQRLVRPHARHAGTHGGMAIPARRLAGDCRCAGRLPQVAGRQDCDVAPRHVAGRSSRPASTVLFDISPRQLLAIGGDLLPSGYRRQAQSAIATAPRRSRSTGRSTGRFPGAPQSAPSGDGASRRHAGRDRSIRTRGRAR